MLAISVLSGFSEINYPCPAHSPAGSRAILSERPRAAARSGLTGHMKKDGSF